MSTGIVSKTVKRAMGVLSVGVVMMAGFLAPEGWKAIAVLATLCLESGASILM